MKKVLILSVAVLMVFAISVTAQAAENNWRFKITADFGTGEYMSSTQLGMYPTSLDGYDSQDGAAQFLPDPYGMTYAAWLTTIIPGRTEAMMKDIKAPFATNDLSLTKTWDVRVFGLRDAPAQFNTIRLRFYPLGSAVAPPSTFNGKQYGTDWIYYIKMINNRGVAGAPANGTEWQIPIPTTPAITTVEFFTLTLPIIRLTASTPANAESEGYVMEYGIKPLQPIPEPSSLLALATGLSGLAGFVIRRRMS
ncbi:MAG: PEP-CTERM sorting domain-containing protein [Armatimonadota bacterium]|nr:PEP-CTERM sorting domain-containing protein [Armatimonadota bacterium]